MPDTLEKLILAQKLLIFRLLFRTILAPLEAASGFGNPMSTLSLVQVEIVIHVLIKNNTIVNLVLVLIDKFILHNH